MTKKPEWPKIPLPPAPPISPPFMRLKLLAGNSIYIRKSYVTAVYESSAGTWVQMLGDIAYNVTESPHEVMDALFHSIDT